MAAGAPTSDLQSYSVPSDGVLSLAGVVSAAAAAGVELLAPDPRGGSRGDRAAAGGEVRRDRWILLLHRISTGNLCEWARDPTHGRTPLQSKPNNPWPPRQSRHRTGAVRTGRCRRGVSEGRDTVQLRVDQVSDGRRPVSLSAVMTSARSPAP